jgi:tRNA(Ile2) C34 agmatinyltransferase TiaS
VTQACLPLRGETRCGYCGDRLTLQPRGDWRCASCGPQLDKVKTVAQWVRFMAAAKPLPRKRRRAPTPESTK